jgi:hypothetical protein
VAGLYVIKAVRDLGIWGSRIGGRRRDGGRRRRRAMGFEIEADGRRERRKQERALG